MSELRWFGVFEPEGADRTRVIERKVLLRDVSDKARIACELFYQVKHQHSDMADIVPLVPGLFVERLRSRSSSPAMIQIYSTPVMERTLKHASQERGAGKTLTFRLQMFSFRPTCEKSETVASLCRRQQ